MNHQIEFVSRDRSGIATLVTPTGVIEVASAIDEIRDGRSTYFAGPNSWDRARVRTLTALGQAYLFANWDGTRRNNLHDLACPAPPPRRSVPVGARRRAAAAVRSALSIFRAVP